MAAPARIDLPRPARPKVCVAIPAARDHGLLEATLVALAALPDAVPFEVRLVMNDAAPALVEFVRERVRGAHVVEAPVNLGTAAAYNRAFAASPARWLLTMHDDAEVQPGALDSLVGRARATPDAGAVGCRVVAMDGRLQDAGHVVWRDGTTSPPWAGPAPAGDVDLPARAVDYHGTVGLLVDREAWEGVGGFDDGYYPAYHVDTDFCSRLRAAGWRVLVEPAATALHHRGSSTSSRFGQWLIERNRTRLERLHGPALAGHAPLANQDPEAVAKEVARAAGAPAGPRPAGAGPSPLLAERLTRPDLHYARAEIALLRDWAEAVARVEREAQAGARDAQEARIADLEAEVARAGASFAETTALLDALAGDHQALLAAGAAREADLAGQRDAAAAAGEAQAEALRGEVAALTRALDDAGRERDTLRAVLDEALASRWWRLGEALRGLDRRRRRG